MKKIELNSKEFRDIVDELKEYLVIVEGKRDVKALNCLGVTKTITISGKSLSQVAISLYEKYRDFPIKVVILTDFDPEGRKMASRLRELLQKYRITPNTGLRRKVSQLGKTSIEDFFASLFSPFKEDDYHGKVGTNFDQVHSKSRNKDKRSSRKA